jgi:signal transduction histidine kinase
MSAHREITQSFDPLQSLESAQAPGLRTLGVQGKLLISFVLLITLAMAGSSWLSASQTSDQMTDLIGEQARLIAYTLSLAAQPSLASGDSRQLDQMGKELLNTRNIMFVAFLDSNHKPISFSKRYADFSWSDVRPLGHHAEDLYMTRPGNSASFGEYVDVYAPVNSQVKSIGSSDQAAPLGYVVVGVSLEGELSQVQYVTWMMAGLGAVIVLVSFPAAYLIVHGIFKPIRELVTATRKIALGQLDFKIGVHRDDMIGELAQAFEDMVIKVRRQREDLALSNRKLADANEKLNSANQQLSEANTALEQKVQQRTVQLETANRRLSGEIAEKEDFLRAVSHDLNAPLRNIAGMTGMLLAKHKEKFDPDIVHRLERIQKNVEVETDLISELLELSRIKTHRQVLEKVEPATIVSDLAGVFEQDLQSKKIALVVDTALPTLHVERARIRQVFQNLIDNAIKYMGDRPNREIHIGSTSGNDETQFYVRDTGVGIEADDVGKVFNVFRRGKNAAAQNIPGKGVGLASVKSIVEMYSGSIWVESKFGEGTTFRFTINGKYVLQSNTINQAAGASPLPAVPVMGENTTDRRAA